MTDRTSISINTSNNLIWPVTMHDIIVQAPVIRSDTKELLSLLRLSNMYKGVTLLVLAEKS